MNGHHGDLPRTTAVARPRTWLLHGGRPLSRFLIRRRFPVRLHGTENVPAHGPVILASNHTGLVDGPLLAIFSPRPVHALTKSEMFRGRGGTLLRAAGQVSLDRFNADPGAVKACVRVLRDGGVVGIFPEGTRGAGDLGRFHRGAAYLGLLTGAPIVPVSQLGTRAPGADSNSLPPRGETVDIVYGAPYSFPAQDWPRTREQVGRSSVLLREHMLAELDAALALTGRELPGPLPAGQSDDDPDTGIVHQGAR
jgi:1-acyl-sn-glycerol-3-phosphate acyltransferase